MIKEQVMKIALSGYYGFDNAGDEALLSAITSTIQQQEADCDFVVFSGQPDHTIQMHGIRAVYYMNPLTMIKELAGTDLLISGGGSIFQDVTSSRSLAYYIAVVALARSLRVPVIFYAQGVGPINRPFNRYLMRLVANRVNMITVRDEDSAQYLKDLGITRPPVTITADPVFSLQPGKSEREKARFILDQAGLSDRPQVGVALRNWSALDFRMNDLARLLDEFAQQGYRVVFIPLAFPEDVEAGRRVAALMKQESCCLEQQFTSLEHLALIGQMDLMIGMRLHALIFAANQGVPFAGISYDPKIDAFLQQFSLDPLPDDLPGMRQAVQDLLGDGEARSIIEQKAAKMRSKAEETALLALKLLKKRPSHS